MCRRFIFDFGNEGEGVNEGSGDHFVFKNDYVRFHAWQSSLIFTTLLVIFGSSWPNSCYQVIADIG